MRVAGICAICGKVVQSFNTCMLCGRNVCNECFNYITGTCKRCVPVHQQREEEIKN